MFTAAALTLLAPILGGTFAQAVALLGTPAGRVYKKILIEAVKSFGRPLTPEQQVRLARTNYANKYVVWKSKKAYNDYVYGQGWETRWR